MCSSSHSSADWEESRSSKQSVRRPTEECSTALPFTAEVSQSCLAFEKRGSPRSASGRPRSKTAEIRRSDTAFPKQRFSNVEPVMQSSFRSSDGATVSPPEKVFAGLVTDQASPRRIDETQTVFAADTVRQVPGQRRVESHTLTAHVRQHRSDCCQPGNRIFPPLFAVPGLHLL